MDNGEANFENIPVPDRDSELRSSNSPLKESHFKYYKVLTVNHLKVSADLANFPLLISIYDIDLHTDVQADGDDIAFRNSTNWLDHEIEVFEQNFNGTHAQLIAWVRVPLLLSSSDTNIYMYYGNSTMQSQQNPTGTWNSNYKAIWHLNATFLDSTVNDNDGINYQSDDVSSKIANGRDYDGVDDYSNMGSGTSIDNLFHGGATISAWINPEGWGGNQYGRILAKSSTTSGTDGWVLCVDGEASPAANHHLLFFHGFDGPTDYRGLWYTPEDSVSLNEWQHVVVTYDASSDSNIPLIYVNGVSQTPLTPEPSPNGNPVDDSSQSLYIGNYAGGNRAFDGVIDEVRLSTGIKPSGWIQTEFNNQNDPMSFYSIGIENEVDFTPPFYSDLIESSDPLELGDLEIITINVTDPSGVNQVLIEFGGTNKSMTNIYGNTWRYNSWTPNSLGIVSYAIYMEDNHNNWNFTTGSFIVVDTTAPKFSNLVESADQLKFGQNETIQIKVFDSPGSGVNETILEYDSANHSMNFIGVNTWSWSNWKPMVEGVHSYKIYMKDNENNWNMTSGNITVITTTAPFIENLTESNDPLELGNEITITVDVYDNETIVSTVLIEIDGTNHTMSNISDTYHFNWTGSSVGTINYIIYANDTGNNWNTLSSSFDIIDTTHPNFADLQENWDILELGETEIITINCTDLSGINQVQIEIDGANLSMTNIYGNTWQYDSWIPTIVGDHIYLIWIQDNNNNWNSTSGSIFVQDTISPSFSDLNESSNPTEVGTTLYISINSTDVAGIKQVLIEYESTNHSMTNIYGNTWQYNLWMPKLMGNYSYEIFLKDNNNNINSTGIQYMVFQDTTCPVYSNLYINSNPLELGETLTVRIEASDFSGINQCLIEYEGTNHSMNNIYGNTWQYDSWTPNIIGSLSYVVFIEDLNGKWNFTIKSIDVQDTTPPDQPILVVSPIGSVSGVIVFDWREGTDPSGISYYILIIDDESNPETNPGYILMINITNNNPDSSYFELPTNFTQGTYYYFLAQVDGAGHQSDYTMGSFTLVLSNGGGNPFDSNLIYIIIIGIALTSIIGITITSIIIKRRIKSKVLTERKKIPINEIIFHINQISKSISSLKMEKVPKVPKRLSMKSEESIKNENLVSKLDEIKKLGQELFEEGAYFEAQKQFKYGKELSIELEKEDEAQLFSDLISGIEGLVEEREKRLEQLNQEKIKGSAVRIFDSYYTLVEISKKLRDLDSAKMYLSELIQTFQTSNLSLSDLYEFQSLLNRRAQSLEDDNYYKKAVEVYEKCKKISQLLSQLGREGEKTKVDDFENKINQCLKNIEK